MEEQEGIGIEKQQEKMEEEKENEEGNNAPKMGFAKWVALRRKFAIDSPFFSAGNVERELLAKQISLEITEEEQFHIGQMEEEQIWQVHCPIVGCGTKLRGLGDLEAHYVSRHTATCSVCARMFPTTRLLNLHVSETHDSFFQAKVARNYPMYECLVEGCAGRFHTDMARLQHLVDKHHFPRSFHFHIKKHASQRQRQRYRTRRTPLPDNGRHQSKEPSMMSEKSADKKAKTGPKPSLSKGISEVQQAGTAEDGRGIMDCGSDLEMHMDVDELTTAVSRLSTTAKEADNTPSLVSFGHRRGHRMPFLSGQQNNPSGRSRGSSHGKQRQTSTLHQT